MSNCIVINQYTTLSSVYLDRITRGTRHTGGGATRGDVIHRHSDVIRENLIVCRDVREGCLEAERGVLLLL